MMDNQTHPQEFIHDWATVLAAVRGGDLDGPLAMKRIDDCIRDSRSAAVRRFLLKARRWIKNAWKEGMRDAG